MTGKNGKDAEAIVTNKQFRALKKKLITTEKNNFSQIILIPRAGEKTKDKDWYEIADNSALLYYYAVCVPLGETVNFVADTNSYFYQYEVGLICMNGMNRLRLLLKKAKLYQEEKRIGDFYIFRLSKQFKKKELEAFKQEELKRRKENNQIIPVTFADPELYQSIRKASEDLHRICNDHMSRLAGETNGVRIVTLIDKIFANYTSLCSLDNPVNSPLAYWKVIYEDIEKLSIEIQIAIAINVINSADGILVCNTVRHAYDRIKYHYNNIKQ